MDSFDLLFKALAAIFGLASVSAALYNVFTAHRRGKNLAEDVKQADRLDKALTLSTSNEVRINALEGRVNNFEARMERRLDQISSDIGKVKELFTEYLIKR